MSTRADEIFEDLLCKILSDAYPAGKRLDSERELAAHYETNRNTLREAIQQLEHRRLVSVRHGQGVTVQDFRKTATMESLSAFLVHASHSEELLLVVEDLLHARTQVLSLSLELAARRATPEDLAVIDALVERQMVNFAARNRNALATTDIEFIDALIDAAHSLTARWIANTILDVYRAMLSRSTALWVYDATFPDYLQSLRVAIGSGDATKAVAATRAYFKRVDGTLIEALQALARVVDVP